VALLAAVPLLAVDEALYEEVKGTYEFYVVNRYQFGTFLLRDDALVLRTGDAEIELRVADRDALVFESTDVTPTWTCRFARDEVGDVAFCTVTVGEEQYEGERADRYEPTTVFSVDAMRADLRQLQDLIKTYHPAAVDFVGQDAFDELVARQAAKLIEPMGPYAFYRILAPVVEALGCGQSAVRMPADVVTWIPQRVFPWVLQYVDSKAYAVRPHGQQPVLPRGAQILSINGVPMEEITQELTALIPADGFNRARKEFELGQTFQYHYGTVYGFPEAFVVAYQPPDGGPVEALQLEPMRHLYSVEYGRGVQLEVWPDGETATLAVLLFHYYGADVATFRSLVDTAFADVRERGIDRLILDLRNNGGGNAECAAVLASYVAAKPTSLLRSPIEGLNGVAEPLPPLDNAFGGELIVLVNGGTFETAGLLCTVLRRRAEFIGSPTGGAYAAAILPTTYDLKETRFQIDLPRALAIANTPGDSKERMIVPDVLILPTPEEMHRGVDVVMEALRERIAGSEGTDT
jgi:hypothetical protein